MPDTGKKLIGWVVALMGWLAERRGLGDGREHDGHIRFLVMAIMSWAWIGYLYFFLSWVVVAVEWHVVYRRRRKIKEAHVLVG